MTYSLFRWCLGFLEIQALESASMPLSQVCHHILLINQVLDTSEAILRVSDTQSRFLFILHYASTPTVSLTYAVWCLADLCIESSGKLQRYRMPPLWGLLLFGTCTSDMVVKASSDCSDNGNWARVVRLQLYRMGSHNDNGGLIPWKLSL